MCLEKGNLMRLIIKDAVDKDRYLSIANNVLNKVLSLLNDYGLLNNENITLNIDHLDFDDVSVEIVFNKRDNGELDILNDNELSNFKALDSSHFLITVFVKRLEHYKDFNNMFDVTFARELFKVFVYLSCIKGTLQLSFDNRALKYMSCIFECLYASEIGYKDHILSIFEDISHFYIRNVDPLNN